MRRFLSFCALLAVASLFGLLAKPAQAETITFQQILAAPDDERLNLQYARQEIASGRLQQAASALERLLLRRPNWDSVRLLYGIVLYRMNDLEGSRRELEALAGRSLNQQQEKRRAEYLDAIEAATRAFRVSGRVTIGGRHDDNPALISDAVIRGINDPFSVVFVPAFNGNNMSDEAFVASARIRFEQDFSNAPGNTVFLQADGFLTNFSEVDIADNSGGAVKAGFLFKRDRLTVSPYAKFQRSRVRDEEFAERWGGGVDVSYNIDPQLKAFATVEFLDEDYAITTGNPNGDERDGSSSFGRIGLMWRPVEQQIFTLALHGERKTAVNDGYAFRDRGITLNSLTLFGSGVYLSLTGKYSSVDFDQPDGNVAISVTREDERRFARAALGAPLGTIFSGFGADGVLPEFMEDMVLQGGIAWSRVESTADVIDYENVTADIMLTKKFAF